MSLASPEFILALKVFYDGSGKMHDPGCRFLNLGSLIGDETTWANLSQRWLEVLEKHSAPVSPQGRRYFHSKEAIHHHDGYAGWDFKRTSDLVFELMEVLAQAGRVDPLPVTCSVNLADYRRMKLSIPALKRPESICLDVCFGLVARHPYRDSGIEIKFDRKETFYPILRGVMKQRDKGRGIWWAEYVSEMSEVTDMREFPGIQAADLLAWLANRYCTHGAGDRWGGLFFVTFLTKKHYYTCIDEAALLSLFEPDGKMRPGVMLPAAQIKAPFVDQKP